MTKFTALTHIKHNHKDYWNNDEIELEDTDAKLLLEIKAICPVSAQNKKNNEIVVPEEFKVYAAKSNKEQIEYILQLEDETVLKSLLPYSKSKAKETIERKLQKKELE